MLSSAQQGQSIENKGLHTHGYIFVEHVEQIRPLFAINPLTPTIKKPLGIKRVSASSTAKAGVLNQQCFKHWYNATLTSWGSLVRVQLRPSSKTQALQALQPLRLLLETVL